MSFSPIAVLIPPEEIKPLDVSLCMLCQSVKSEKLIEKPGKVQIIIKTTIEHDNLKTGKYIDLAKITITDRKTLDIISYHKTCNQKFITDGISMKRAREKEKIVETLKSSGISHVVYQDQ